MSKLRDEKNLTFDDTLPLLRALAEDLKLPLMHISRKAELSIMANHSGKQDMLEFQHSADSALELIDCYILGLQLFEKQQVLPLEPVSIGLTIEEVAQKLIGVANRYEVDLQLNVTNRCKPVMAHKTALKAALISMGSALIEAQTKTGKNNPIVIMTASMTSRGVEAGVYGSSINISSAQLRFARNFFGKVRQPLGQMSSNNAAGIFIAQQILESMSSELRVAKNHSQSGLVAILQRSQQLQLIT